MLPASQPDPQRLGLFLASFRAAREQAASLPASSHSLRTFLQAYAELRLTMPEPPAPLARLVDAARLAGFLQAFRPLAEASRRRGDGINVWQIAGLKNKEVRIAAVLRWLLDPRGSHGRGPTLLRAWLSRLDIDPALGFPDPAQLSARYTTHTETVPLGDAQNRVDIEIEGTDFFLLVEVKVDAVEGKKQVNRYADVAHRKANGRPHLVIYLSKVERPSEPGESAIVVSTTWGTLAQILRNEIYADPTGSGFADQAILQFATFVLELSEARGS